MKEMLKDPVWFSVADVINHFRLDILPGPPGVPVGEVPKKAKEIWAAAAMLAGMQEVEGRQYWMQPVSDSEGSPDVRSIRRIEQPDGRAANYELQDVEVVSYTPASVGEPLPDFLLRTKLGPKKAYDNLTAILLWMDAKVDHPGADVWKEKLAGIQNSGPVLIVGLSNPRDVIYKLVQVYPDYATAEYNLPETLAEQGYRGTIRLERGSKDVTTEKVGEVHCPFESFDVVCQALKKI